MTTYWEARNEAYIYFDANIRNIPHTIDGNGNFVPTNLTGPNGVHNNDVDAFRHAYTSAVFTREWGSGIAHILGDGNELFGDIRGQGADNRNMDKWNNEKGRLIGHDFIGQGNYKAGIASAVASSLANGHLITSPSDPRDYAGADAFGPILDALGDVIDSLLENIDKLFDDVPYWADHLSDAIDDKLLDARDLYNDALTLLTPIVLDLDGDGIELTSLAGSATFFDLNANQFAEKTGWVQSDDGLLARDLNGNGIIDNQNELFGPIGGAVHGYRKAIDRKPDTWITS